MSRSFGSHAGAYEAGRPDYPADAVEWMLSPARTGSHALRVADVGAGTGKLTRVLVAAGAETVAVEPDPAMLAVLHEGVPGVPTFVGTAEKIPLPSASVDAVVLGQAWHWVDADAASIEIGRVVRAGGVLGLIWNLRDEGVDWVARMSEIMHGSNAERMIAEGGVRVASPFGTLERTSLRWSRMMTRESLLAMARSRSYVITAESEDRARIEAGLDALFDEIGAIGDAEIELPYVTTAYRTVREG